MTETKQQILARRKKIEKELEDMLRENKSSFSLHHVRDAIFHEEETGDMMKVVAMFDNGGDAVSLAPFLNW